MDYFLDCKQCTNIDDQCSFNDFESIPEYQNLKRIFYESIEEDRHYSYTNSLLKCKHCRTIYYHFTSIDIEDAFVGGPDLRDEFQRVNLIRLKELLKTLGLDSELNDLNSYYDGLIHSLEKVVMNFPEKIIKTPSTFFKSKPYYFNYVIESICDYYIEKNDFKGFEKKLLMHKNPQIVFKTIIDIILMYKEKSRDTTFPSFVHYKGVSLTTQKRIRPFIKKHINKITAHMVRYQNAEEEWILSAYNSLLSKIDYYLNE